ncbi:hypothetical protein B2J93_9441 [Marssonina coronariae]|uniref:Uncharacterized protein n=1 Tax=Diplocarpon coronariae TaxID=2795749 RepID=A0A218YWM4_9HELO|nr:hypothetical protein B2J93_9441 [Marssonina coronariae]
MPNPAQATHQSSTKSTPLTKPPFQRYLNHPTARSASPHPLLLLPLLARRPAIRLLHVVPAGNPTVERRTPSSRSTVWARHPHGPRPAEKRRDRLVPMVDGWLLDASTRPVRGKVRRESSSTQLPASGQSPGQVT